jgi:hypothetical protein
MLDRYASTPIQHSIEGEPWVLWIREKKLSNKVSEKVYQYIHNNDTSIYWSNKLGPNAHVTDIDWDAISVA